MFSASDRFTFPIARSTLARSTISRTIFIGVLLSARLLSAQVREDRDHIAGDRFAGDHTALDQLRLNQLQMIGTHNSYHIAQPATVREEIAKISRKLAESHDYSHRPLSEQFSQLGIRQIELDIFVDSSGGLFANPTLTTLIPDAAGIDDPTGAMKRPGLKVLHVQDIDYLTTTPTFIDALKQVHDWLKMNPNSEPMMLLLELKQSSIGPIFTQPEEFTAEQFDLLDKEILSVFPPEQIIRPDDVRGEYATLREAVLAGNWPTLKQSRGKVLFAMDNGGELRDGYLQGHPSLRDRLLFVSVSEDHPAAAFMKLNDPVGGFDHIQQMVKKGFLVRTRADADTLQSRNNDTSQRDKALASGAQYVSTDYPEPDDRFSDYQVRLPNKAIIRRNPVLFTEPGLVPEENN